MTATTLSAENDYVPAPAATSAAPAGFERMLGYGLKYGSAFVDTHLGRSGRKDR